MFLAAPLKDMRLTQPFGVDYVGDGFYSKAGLKGHPGIDLSAKPATPTYAAMEGMLYNAENESYGLHQILRSKVLGLEVLCAHLSRFVLGNRNGVLVKRGDLISMTGNTGKSTGPHLHFAVRPVTWEKSGAGPYYPESGNGYAGYMDPLYFLAPDVFELPVDRKYGNSNKTPGVPGDIQWYGTALWFWRHFGRLMTTREMHALRYGFWDVRTVMDDAMFDVWSRMSKPQALLAAVIK